MAILTRETILQASDLRRELVAVPEWGGEVYVRSLTGAERDSYEAGMLDVRGMTTTIKLENARARLVCLAVCDDQGVRLFELSDVQALAGKSAVALERVFESASRLSGLSKADVEELVKN